MVSGSNRNRSADVPLGNRDGLCLCGRRARVSAPLGFLEGSKPLLLVLEHLLLARNPGGDDAAPLRRWPEVQTVDTELFQRLALDDGVLRRVRAVEVERRAQGDRRVRDDAQGAQVVLRRGVQHERVQEDDVARLARHLDEARAFLDLVEIREVLRVVLRLGVCRCRRCEGEACGQDAFWVVCEVPCDHAHAVGRNICPAPSWYNLSEDGNNEEGLLGRVEVVNLIPDDDELLKEEKIRNIDNSTDKEISIDMPVIQILRCDRQFCVLRLSEIDNESVIPVTAFWINAFLPAEQIFHRSPRLRNQSND